MNSLPLAATSAPLPQGHAHPLARKFGIIALLLGLNMVLQWRTGTMADWINFVFYDPGTILKGDWLIAKGYVPTVDFGYTHGLLPLLYGRIGFAILGRSPFAFLMLTAALQLAIAWALARLVIAFQLRPLERLLFYIALPMAIMPAYLTLTHPFEAALILLALADQAEGKSNRSLAIITACLFVKPSMAYVYGFLLTLFVAKAAFSHRGPRIPALLRAYLPAITNGTVFAVILIAYFGFQPVLHTVLPLTGAKTYNASGFGFFNAGGQQFWVRPHLIDYFIHPPGVFLIAATAVFIGAIAVAIRFLIRVIQRPDHTSPTDRRLQLLFTIGCLHTAFLVGFYGWSGSWNYYSYLPILGLLLILNLWNANPLRSRVTALLILWMAASHIGLLGDIVSAWTWKINTNVPLGLWASPSQQEEWKEALAETHGQPTVVMSVGWLPFLPPNAQMMDAWFPEPGIATPPEIARIQQQLEHAKFVIVWRQYGRFDVWNSDELRPQQALFTGDIMGPTLQVFRRTH